MTISTWRWNGNTEEDIDLDIYETLGLPYAIVPSKRKMGNENIQNMTSKYVSMIVDTLKVLKQAFGAN